MSKQLHIVSFDVPYPPNYGGVIDVFYKLKSLHQLGVQIILHTYTYGRKEEKELEKYCFKIFYYKRDLSKKHLISKMPFIVKTRNSILLIENLKKTKAPILFEGLHTTFPILKSIFKDQKIAIRTHNIEHDYYNGLSQSETKIFKKIFLITESKKLKFYEKIVEKSNVVFTISPFEQEYFSTKHAVKSVYIPVFHQNNVIKNLTSNGEFALYHGDLRVSDNLKAVRFLMDVFFDIDYKLIIASSFSNQRLEKEIKKQKNTQFIAITSQKIIEDLLKNAHINTLITFQKTGIKLKLLNTLFNSRFTIANSEMIEDTGLESLCTLSNSKEAFKTAILQLKTTDYTPKHMDAKKEILKQFNPLESAQKIIDELL